MNKYLDKESVHRIPQTPMSQSGNDASDIVIKHVGKSCQESGQDAISWRKSQGNRALE